MLTEFRNRNLQSGVELDTRSPEEKQRDYRFEEMVSSPNRVIWKEKKPEQWRKFPIFDQNGSGSCVAQTMAKLLGIIYWLKNNVYVHFSATDIYQRRENKNQSGMAGVDVFKIAQKGVTLEVLAPSQGMTDAEMDSYVIAEYKKRVGEIFKIGNYVFLPTGDLDTVTSVIQTTGKGVMLWFYFTRKEWNDLPIVQSDDLVLYANSTLRHSVAGVDFAIYKGEEGVVVDDSWGANTAIKGQRFISRKFFEKRNFLSAYPIDFKFEEATPEAPKPKYQFNRDLEYTPVVTYGDQDVVALQNCLKYLGLFPKNIESTGWFGSMTKDAVIEFQKKYGIVPVAGYVGIRTRTKLNELFK